MGESCNLFKKVRQNAGPCSEGNGRAYLSYETLVTFLTRERAPQTLYFIPGPAVGYFSS